MNIKRPKVTYYVVNSNRNEGKDYFEINRETGEIFTKVIFDREKQGAYALEVEARDGAPSARPNSNGQPNSANKIKYWPSERGKLVDGELDVVQSRARRNKITEFYIRKKELVSH
ncbi:hypothetical protein KQX54_008610 [Cotesia glomerata]|uniref:Cadherin domain-containing protein n=1 Tax=Cotesia glomerata TaxID=32391 RepID=A0AAV7J2K6_COTGL|nr:hypothetical protein KQX54_008610 [Cotesia glomerata]